jgi:hypothetical protein
MNSWLRLGFGKVSLLDLSKEPSIQKLRRGSFKCGVHVVVEVLFCLGDNEYQQASEIKLAGQKGSIMMEMARADSTWAMDISG